MPQSGTMLESQAHSAVGTNSFDSIAIAPRPQIQKTHGRIRRAFSAGMKESASRLMKKG